MAKTKATAIDPVLKPVFHEEFERIKMRVEFLQAAYEGGVNYKNARDQFGLPVLIAHENELGGSDTQLIMAAQAMLRGTWNTDVLTKHGRRRRAAVYENHVKPIIDKVTGYTLRAIPSRLVSEDLLNQYDVDTYIKDLVVESLKVGHYWIGIDAQDAPVDEEGEKVEIETKADEDEAGLSGMYLRLVDPLMVVDWEEDDEGEIIRVVIHEPEAVKKSFTESRETTNYYVEWTPETWTRYKEVEDKQGTHLLRIDGGPNTFKRKNESGEMESFVPFYRFEPPFPTEDLAEMNRALFNTMSLLDEELMGNTFTQKVITGATPENVEKTGSGVGNVMVLPEADAKLYVVGAIPDQAAQLAARVDQLREAMYWLANLEGTQQKNVAESGDKKKRDMETLYTMLQSIVEYMEYCENWVLWSLGLIDGILDPKATNYPRKFDVSSVADIIQELAEMMKLPFAPPSLKRRKMKELIQHLSPMEKNKELEDEVDQLPDISETALKAIETMFMVGQLNPELTVRILGMPEDMQKAIAEADAAAKEHEVQQAAEQRNMEMKKLEIAASAVDAKAQASAGKSGKQPPFAANSKTSGKGG